MTQTPVRAEVLTKALDATMKSRNQSYGDPYPNLRLAADMLALYHTAAGKKYNPAHDAAIAMILAKIARIATGAVGHEDNYVDGAAYFAIAAECQTVGSVVWQNSASVLSDEEIKTLMGNLDNEEIKTLMGKLDVENYRTALDAEYKAQGFIVEDPINADTKLPPEPERVVEEHKPVDRKPIVPMIDPNSPAKAYSNGTKAFKLGSLVAFGVSENEPLYLVINIQNGDLGEFTAQHESSGGRYHGIAAHIHKVVVY